MNVKNKRKNPMIFGDTKLAPNAVGELREPYTEKHPYVAMCLKKGWLTKVQGGGKQKGDQEDSTTVIDKKDQKPEKPETK